MYATSTLTYKALRLATIKTSLRKSNDSNSTGLALLGKFGIVFQL